jgi:hypothetical protein
MMMNHQPTFKGHVLLSPLRHVLYNQSLMLIHTKENLLCSMMVNYHNTYKGKGQTKVGKDENIAYY